MGDAAGPALDLLLEGQQTYYRERAHEYDDWWERRGRYDRGEAHTDAWRAEISQLESAVDDFAPTGDVLELAAGTGNWTRQLARHASHVTAVDGSAETLAINRQKTADALAGTASSGMEAADIDYVVGDLFDWEPPRRFDVVMFGFWLSHVPDGRLDEFWTLVDKALAPDGRVLIIDSAHPDLATAGAGAGADVHNEPASAADGSAHPEVEVATRTLGDGREFQIVKRFWRPAELVADTTARGWSFEAEETEHFFFLARGARL